jgi:hypothetical protein
VKQADVIIGEEYLARINGSLCRVKVTRKYAPDKRMGERGRTMFDWVRIDPPDGAKKLTGSDTAASLRPAPRKG